MTRFKSSKNRLTAAAAEAALSKLSALSLLSGKDLQRLRFIADAIDDTLQCSLNDLWDTLFQGLEPVNAETTLRKLKLRLKEVQQEAVLAGQLNERDMLELEVNKKSGNAPRFLWFLGPVTLSVEPRTEDIEGVPQNALQAAPALRPELAGQAPAGSEPILILTINDHETRAVREVFSPGQTPRQFERDIRNYELLGYAGPRPVIGYRCRMGSLGPGSALIATVQAIAHHRPAVVLGVGIAFGNKTKKQQLSDVLISTEVRNYESERVNPDAQPHIARGPDSGFHTLGHARYPAFTRGIQAAQRADALGRKAARPRRHLAATAQAVPCCHWRRHGRRWPHDSLPRRQSRLAGHQSRQRLGGTATKTPSERNRKNSTKRWQHNMLLRWRTPPFTWRGPPRR